MGRKILPVPKDYKRDKTMNFMKKEIMQIYIDENIENEIVEFLKDKKFNIKTYKDSGLQGRGDEDHFNFTKKDNRVLVTKDSDFRDNKSYPIKGHPGIIILRYNDYHEAALVLDVLIKIIKPYAKAYEESKVLIYQNELKIYGKHEDEGKRGINRYKLEHGNAYIREED